MKATPVLVPVGLVILVSACQSSPNVTSDPVDARWEADEVAPMALDGSVSSNWAYLLSKYDGDGDQRIEFAEYNRDRDNFDRLDRDDDGVLSIEDFPALDEESFRGFYRDQRALRVLGAHFQADEDTAELRLEELEWMIMTYDLDYDDAIDAEEFAAGAEEHRREVDDGDDSGTERAMMGDYDAWEVLIEAVDDDGDGRLATRELVAFFNERDDGDQVLSMRGGASEEARRPDTSGVLEGEMAPDFSLEPPDGGERVTLSSFRGKKPVALVFGSYT